MNLGDPQLELIDPTPNVHSLFLHFDKVFFWAKLASRAVVRWSKRMYSCAGICSYEGYGGLCDIALSEPLLKLRPRKDLVETLLHEMIHAYLFITNRDRDRDGHGPTFQAHMHRINKCAGLNISIYHDFHDEVKLYQTHWWRCDGPCQTRKPYFGIVRKTANRPPSPKDYWWEQHRRSCGGTFVKIKEPEQQNKKAASKASKKPNADITKYVTTTKNSTGDLNCPTKKGVLKDSNNIPNRPVISTKKGVVYNPQPIFTGVGKILNDNTDMRKRSNSVAVMETVRNVWANKQLPTAPNQISNNMAVTNVVRNIWANKQLPTAPSQVNNNKPTLKDIASKVINNKKHKSDNVLDSPPIKMKKIDDYFKNAATVLKDLYGQDFNVSKSKDEKKLVALPVKSQVNVVKQEDAVDCPICNIRVKSSEINRHLDECLNKEVISDICNDNQSETNLLNINIKSEDNSVSSVKTEPGVYVTKQSAGIMSSYNNNNNVIKTEINIKTEPMPSHLNNDLSKAREKDKLNRGFYSIDLTNLDSVTNSVKIEKHVKPELKPAHTSNDNYINKAKEIAKQIDKNKRRSVDFTNIKSINNFDANKAIKAERSNNIFTTLVDNDINTARENANKIKQGKQLRKSDSFSAGFKDKQDIINTNITIEPGTSKGLIPEIIGHTCPCCDRKVNKPIDEHLDECLAFFDNNTTIPEEGASTSTANQAIIVIDDDNDEFDESLTLNATGTKCPCPCCLEMVEQDEMNEHLDNCLK